MKKRTIRLNKKFYPLAAIEQTKVEFAHLCKLTKVDDSFVFELEFSEGVDPDTIAHEFCNFCLGTVKQNGN